MIRVEIRLDERIEGRVETEGQAGANVFVGDVPIIEVRVRVDVESDPEEVESTNNVTDLSDQADIYLMVGAEGDRYQLMGHGVAESLEPVEHITIAGPERPNIF